MDEVERTLVTYEGNAETYAEKYLSESGLEAYGGPFLDRLDGGRVLDLGCGPGIDAAGFARRGLDVVGLDITESFLRRAHDYLADATPDQQATTSFVRGDMRSLPFEADSFDGIWASGSFHHVPREQAPDTAVALQRLLRDGGCAYISAKRGPTGSEVADRHFEFYEPGEFRALLADAGFDVEIIETTGPWIGAIARV
ncbi:class I SAM-dependent methyltransferase [Halobacteriales archaeon SW_10_66_29]|nr:MAG: class I SAM-dependent methyltransferase [Halobacteriales archaeon SW_10_66_29]